MIVLSGIDMYDEHYFEHGEMFVRISKPKAKSLFEKGKVVYLLQSKMNSKSMWSHPYPISKERLSAIGSTFENHVNDYKYYNCNPEYGKEVKYFVNNKDNEIKHCKQRRKQDFRYTKESVCFK